MFLFAIINKESFSSGVFYLLIFRIFRGKSKSLRPLEHLFSFNISFVNDEIFILDIFSFVNLTFKIFIELLTEAPPRDLLTINVNRLFWLSLLNFLF